LERILAPSQPLRPAGAGEGEAAPGPLARAHAETDATALGVQAPSGFGVSVNELGVLTRLTEDTSRFEVAASDLRGHVQRHA
jgi:hypothetical protein